MASQGALCNPLRAWQGRSSQEITWTEYLRVSHQGLRHACGILREQCTCSHALSFCLLVPHPRAGLTPLQTPKDRAAARAPSAGLARRPRQAQSKAFYSCRLSSHPVLKMGVSHRALSVPLRPAVTFGSRCDLHKAVQMSDSGDSTDGENRDDEQNVMVRHHVISLHALCSLSPRTSWPHCC